MSHIIAELIDYFLFILCLDLCGQSVYLLNTSGPYIISPPSFRLDAIYARAGGTDVFVSHVLSPGSRSRKLKTPFIINCLVISKHGFRFLHFVLQTMKWAICVSLYAAFLGYRIYIIPSICCFRRRCHIV